MSDKPVTTGDLIKLFHDRMPDPTRRALKKDELEMLENIVKCSETGLSAFYDGINAIGNMLSSYSCNKDWGIKESDIFGIGWMLSELGGLMASLDSMRDDAQFRLMGEK